MSEARNTIDSVVAAVLAGKELPVSLSELQSALETLEAEGGPVWNTGSTPQFVYSNRSIPEWYDYSIDRLDDVLSDERYDELKAGAEPTEKEIGMWREAYIEDFWDDPEWDGGYIFRSIEDSKGREIVALLQTSGGGWDYGESIDGIFRSHEEAREAMEAKAHNILESF